VSLHDPRIDEEIRHHIEERAVLVREISPNGVPFTVSEPNYQDYRDRLRRVELLTATSRADYATATEGRARHVIAGRVTPSFFPLFGGSPVLGRALSRAESGADPPAAVVLTHDFLDGAFLRRQLRGRPVAGARRDRPRDRRRHACRMGADRGRRRVDAPAARPWRGTASI